MSGRDRYLRTFDSTVHASLSVQSKAKSVRFCACAVHAWEWCWYLLNSSNVDIEGSQSDRRMKPFAFLQKRKISSQCRLFTVPGPFGANTKSVDARGAIFMALLIKLGYCS